MTSTNPGPSRNASNTTLTARSTTWELAQSWWILLTFSLFFYWVPFLYIGIRTRQRKWWLWGLFYAIPFIMAFAVPTESWAFDLAVGLSILFEAATIFHAFRVRREFLLRLAALQEVDKRKRLDLLAKIELEYGVDIDGQGIEQAEPPRFNPDRQSSQQVIAPDSNTRNEG
jgi:hypothetical protein